MSKTRPLEVIERRAPQDFRLNSEAEQDNIAMNERASIESGGHDTHSVWAASDMWSHGVHFKHNPVVGLCNDGDPYYIQYFTSREDVNAFIAELQKAADEAWGETK